MPRRLLDSPWTAPAICCLVAAVFRFYDLGQASLWRDEIYSIGESESLAHIVVRKGNGFGYFFLLHMMRSVFGTSPISLRILSAIAGTLAALVVWAIALKISGRRSAALIAALGIAVLPLHVLLSREARMYSLWALALWAAYFCLLKLDSGRRVAAFGGAVVALAAAFSFHNFSLIYMPGLFLAWWLYPHRPEYRRQKQIDGALLAAAVLLIGGLLALRLALQVPDFFQFLKSLALEPLWARRMGLAESFLQLSFFPAGAQTLSSFSTTAAVAILIGFWLVAVFQSIHLVGRQKALGAAIAFLFPILLFAVFPIRHYPRLLLPCALYLVLPFAFWASRLKRGPYRTGLGLLILGGLLGNAWRTTQVDREPWNVLCEQIAATATDKTVIAAWPSQTFNSFGYCYRGKGQLIKFPELLNRRAELTAKDTWILLFPFFTKASNLEEADALEDRLQLKRVTSPVPELRVLAPASAQWQLLPQTPQPSAP
jgi:4-amino-4-deoxy-L-arabinose transferase-like glycosyltransferase